MKSFPPQSEQELLDRAQNIAGLTLYQLATQHELVVPLHLMRHKGWVGQLIELSLGANAGNLSIPDFYQLGIELKTIPVNLQGKPLESTFVCMIALLNASTTWMTSEVKAKLSRVLWVPIEVDKNLPLAKRKIGMPRLWSPTKEQEQILRTDWEELTDMIYLGQLEKVHARLGTYLQIRPKAANSRSLCYGINEEGDKILTLPRGFYLRSSFTSQILQ